MKIIQNGHFNFSLLVMIRYGLRIRKTINEHKGTRSFSVNPSAVLWAASVLGVPTATELLAGVREGTGTFKFWYLGTPADSRSM